MLVLWVTDFKKSSSRLNNPGHWGAVDIAPSKHLHCNQLGLRFLNVTYLVQYWMVPNCLIAHESVDMHEHSMHIVVLWRSSARTCYLIQLTVSINSLSPQHIQFLLHFGCWTNLLQKMRKSKIYLIAVFSDSQICKLERSTWAKPCYQAAT